jgi:hypothetical protein
VGARETPAASDRSAPTVIAQYAGLTDQSHLTSIFCGKMKGPTAGFAPVHCAPDIAQHFRKDLRLIPQGYAIALDGLLHILQSGLVASLSTGWGGLGRPSQSVR